MVDGRVGNGMSDKANNIIVFRVDSSVDIGTGHVMRCLTLADELRRKGAKIFFICRNFSGNISNYIRSKNYRVYLLEAENECFHAVNKQAETSRYAHWLEVSQYEDAEQCRVILEKFNVEWLIVDHYGIDYYWHACLKGNYQKLMVIDDLADRKVDCDLLLDQTFGRKDDDYKNIVVEPCELLLGAKFAMLRPEFLEWREFSLNRRKIPELKNILVTMGGVDINNITEKILDVLNACALSVNVNIMVVMGAASLNLNTVKKKSEGMRYKTIVNINVNNMAELMAKSDLSIGAVGSTTWERCALGVPTIMLVIADNQKYASVKLAEANIGWVVSTPEQVCDTLKILLSDRESLISVSKVSSDIIDGRGVERVSGYLKNGI